MKVDNPFGKKYPALELPEGTKVIDMPAPQLLQNPATAIREGLEHPIGGAPLSEIARAKKAAKPEATAIILVSDNTRPVPYKGESGILLPIVETLLREGFKASEILVLVATGTHRLMSEDEIRSIIDPKVFELGIRVENHDARNPALLTNMGQTKRGTEVLIDSRYLAAALRIASGLIESHFMAGASGGRKSVCPGVVGEKTTYVFHCAEFMIHENARELIIKDNPVHEESLEVAKMAGVDFIVNVTLDRFFRITGLFCGDLEKAHLAGVDRLIHDIQVRGCGQADVIITHAGFVGINHYQSVKCAVAALGILKKDGYIIILADNTDAKDIIGSHNYKTTLALLKCVGPDNFDKVLLSKDWTFIPDQWQVQEWAKVFRVIPMEHLYFCSPQVSAMKYGGYPGIDGATVGDGVKNEYYSDCVGNIMKEIQAKEGNRDLKVFYVADGPYVSLRP